MTAERAVEVARFLTAAGWGTAAREPLAGDASGRRYERLYLNRATRVLMDAPGTPGACARFVSVAEHLLACGLSAPRIFARDVTQGLILLEDFGDARYPDLLDTDPARERALFEAAADTLTALHDHPAPEAPDLGPAMLTAQAGLAYDSYLPALTGRPAQAEMQQMQAALAAAFADLPPWSPVLVLRDFHAGNLFWLPDRAGAARVGLIDFQDAGLGHPVYDLVSLARDARRDVAPETVAAMRDRYLAAIGQDHGAAWSLFAVQRNLRILGIFARLARDSGKPHYLDFLPRTWALMQEDLAHPSLTRLKALISNHMPPPTPDRIQRLKTL